MEAYVSRFKKSLNYFLLALVGLWSYAWAAIRWLADVVLGDVVMEQIDALWSGLPDAPIVVSSFVGLTARNPITTTVCATCLVLAVTAIWAWIDTLRRPTAPEPPTGPEPTEARSETETPPIRVDRIVPKFAPGEELRVLIHVTVTGASVTLRRAQSLEFLHYNASWARLPRSNGGIDIVPVNVPPPVLDESSWAAAGGEMSAGILDSLEYSPPVTYERGERIFTVTGQVVNWSEVEDIEQYRAAVVLHARWSWADRPDAYLATCQVLVGRDRALPCIKFSRPS